METASEKPRQTKLASRIERELRSTAREFSLPGAAVVFVSNGRVVYESGVGVQEIGRAGVVTTNTLFKVGSISKTFTALGVGLLVQERKLNWEDRLAAHIPELTAANPRVASLTLRQLLSHTTELNLDPLEPLLWPQPNAFVFANVTAALSALGDSATSDNYFLYSNVGYALLGEVISRTSRMAYGEFISERIFNPLQMRCVTGGFDSASALGIAQPHLVDARTAQVIRRDEGIVAEGLDAAAGGVRCDINAMGRWLRFQLSPQNSALEIKDAIWREIRRGVAVTNTVFDRSMYPTQAELYGLGIQLVADQSGLRLEHYGGVAGMLAYFAVYPERNTAFAMLTNASAGQARKQLVSRLHALATNQPLPARPKRSRTERLDTSAPVDKRIALTDETERAFFGRFEDAWFGEVHLCNGERKSGGLLSAKLSPRFVGRLAQTSEGLVSVHWLDPAIDSDAIVVPTAMAQGRVQRFVFKPLARSDFDFRAMAFTRVGECP